MPTANPVNWFEIPTTDLQRAKKFYEAAFGIELTLMEKPGMKMAWFPMEMGAPGAAGTLVNNEHFTPSHDGSLVYFNVPSIEATLEKIGKVGGKTLMPLMSIGEHGTIAHFEDTEGNRVALHQYPAQA